MLKRTVYIQPETDAALLKLGGKTRAENLRRAVALAEVAGELELALSMVLNSTLDDHANVEEACSHALARYKEAKQ